MEFLNLSVLQFLGILGAVSAVTVALYLLDRTRRRQVVSTLRFWVVPGEPAPVSRRRRIQQPLSLLLQLLGMGLLLLAIAEFQFGGSPNQRRDHVLVLDTSAWMAASAPGRADTTLMDEARANALGWLRAVPATDRVLLVRADGLATPATSWETDRKKVVRAILDSQPGATALNLSENLEFARELQRQSGAVSGEIVYVGPGRILSREANSMSLPPMPAFRVLPVDDAVENAGIRSVGARRSETDAGTWDVLVRVRNYGARARVVNVTLNFGKAPEGMHPLEIAAGAEQETSFKVRSVAAGLLEARVYPKDAFAPDNYAALEIPAQRSLHVVVYSDQPESIRPALASDPRVQAEFRSRVQYTPANDGLVILDRFHPDVRPHGTSVSIEDSGGAAGGGAVTWTPDQPLTEGLRARNIQIESAAVLGHIAGDVTLAAVDKGPVMIVRGRAVLLGFNPFAGGMRYELATPILIGNILRWAAPEVFRDVDVTTQSAGAVSSPLAERMPVQVITDSGSVLPYNIRDKAVQFFSGEPARVRVIAGNSERVYSLTLPEMWDVKWTPPGGVRRGIPGWTEAIRRSLSLWPFLAGAGTILLIVEFVLGQSLWPLRLPQLVKAAMVIAVIAALTKPSMETHESKVALAALSDTSASIGQEDLAKESLLLKQIQSAKGSNLVSPVSFAGAQGRSTNLEAPIRSALAALPAGTIHRIVLISDGNENDGSATRAAWQAQQLGVPIDTIALAGRVQPQLQTQAVGIPGTVFTGERFPVDLTIYSPKATQATVELSAEGKAIGSHEIALAAGENRVRIKTTLSAAGAIDLGGRVVAPGLGESRFENAVAVRRPKVVWVSDDPAGSEEHIAGVLAANRFDLVSMKTLPANLEDTQLVVFNNENLDAMRASDKQRVEEYVQRGGGALWIAGENSAYVDHKGVPEDPIERTFPAKLAPPRSPEGTCVVLIIDKSSSMEGRKIELARVAAIGVVDNLRPDDHVGVLMFDNSFQWAVPIRKADDKDLIKRQISGIIPDGGTQIAPALNEAYKRIIGVNATYRHIVLLTDGISEEGDSMALAKQAVENKVTISTVGLGQDVNRTYLEKIAEDARGKSYFLNEPNGLEQILLKDVKEHTGTTAIEKPIKALAKHPSDLLDQVEIGSAPALAGYVRFDKKPSGDEILEVDEKDPLLVRWQYGLGRAAVFASDAKSRWASSWVTWNGFDRLWTNIFRDLLPHGDESEAVAHYDAANEDLLVEYHLTDRALEPTSLPDVYVIGPGNFRKPLELDRVSPGNYRGRAHIGTLEGLFRIRPLAESRAFPEVGLYRQESELSDYGSNDVLLKSIAQATGGRFNPSVSQLFDNGGRYIESSMRLWPGLLALAIGLNLIELVMRKWRGIILNLRAASS